MKNKSILLLTIFPLLTGCSFMKIADNSGPIPSNNDATTPSDDKPNDNQNQNSGDTNKPSDNNNSNNNENNNDEVVPTTDQTFLDFFDYDSKVEIELKFTNESITKLKEYAEGEGNSNFERNERYHPCTAKITLNGNTTTFEELGVRMKGNLSRDTNFVDSQGHFDTNHLCHFKVSFNQTYDDNSFYYVHNWGNDEAGKKDRDGRKYGGMKKLDLKWNRNHDGTFTKEAYALDAFRSEGVMAQHCNLVKLTVKSDSDEFTEIYQALESVDKRMLKAINKNDDKGDLYKYTYTNEPATLNGYQDYQIGVEGPNYRPLYDLKTNETNNDFSSMKNFINEVKKTKKDDGLDGQDYYDNISKYMDVDNFLKFSALSWIFGMPDDLRNNYNNYYIYFNKDNKAYFIPYDNDRCLGLRYGWDKDLKNVRWDETEAIGSGGFNQCPLILRFVSGGSNNSHPVHQTSKDIYYQYCVEYANKYLNDTRFQEFTNHFEYAPSKNISHAGQDNDTFSTYASNKKATLN